MPSPEKRGYCYTDVGFRGTLIVKNHLIASVKSVPSDCRVRLVPQYLRRDCKETFKLEAQQIKCNDKRRSNNWLNISMSISFIMWTLKLYDKTLYSRVLRINYILPTIFSFQQQTCINTFNNWQRCHQVPT